jgi:hypothetical protein
MMAYDIERVSARRAQPLSRAGAATTGVLLAVIALVALGACTRAEDKPLPTDPKARSEFIEAQTPKLTEESRRLLTRFMKRVTAQEAAGGPAPTVSISKALELQRTYDSEVAQVQSKYQELINAANADVRVDVREQSIVKNDSGKSASGKALRYVLDITNTGKRVIDRVVLRVDFRDAAGKYLATVPGLELKGPLKPGEAGRTTQAMLLSPQFHATLLEGRPARITGTPTQIVYAGGETLDPAVELKKLETISRNKIE